MVSHELQKRKHHLWLDVSRSSAQPMPAHAVSEERGKESAQQTEDDTQYAFHPAGLFPALLRFPLPLVGAPSHGFSFL